MRSGVICARKSTNVSGGFRTSNEAVRLGSMDIAGRRWRSEWGARYGRHLRSQSFSGLVSTVLD